MVVLLLEVGVSDSPSSPESSVKTKGHDHIWAQETVLPAEGVYDQEVADHAGDADGEDDGADGVVGVVGHVHCGEGVRGLGHHRHLEDKTGNDRQM